MFCFHFPIRVFSVKRYDLFSVQARKPAKSVNLQPDKEYCNFNVSLFYGGKECKKFKLKFLTERIVIQELLIQHLMSFVFLFQVSSFHYLNLYSVSKLWFSCWFFCKTKRTTCQGKVLCLPLSSCNMEESECKSRWGIWRRANGRRVVDEEYFLAKPFCITLQLVTDFIG